MSHLTPLSSKSRYINFKIVSKSYSWIFNLLKVSLDEGLLDNYLYNSYLSLSVFANLIFFNIVKKSIIAKGIPNYFEKIIF